MPGRSVSGRKSGILVSSHTAVLEGVLSSSARLAFLCGTLLLVLAVAASGQFGVPLGQRDPKLEAVTVRELVSRYCRTDYAGARLNPADWPKLEPLVAWRTNPDYPLFMVTSRFDVDAELGSEHGKYQVTVHYRLVGKYDMSEGYSQESASQIQEVHFVVSEVNGDWRITDADPSYPHVSKAAALQWLSKKLADAQDPVAKITYQHAIDQLQPQKASPPAK